MAIAHQKVTGFSGNEIFCLNKLGHEAGQLCLGNSVVSMGVMRGLGAGLSNLAGGEVAEITKLVGDGRRNAYKRMIEEANQHGGVGLAGVSFNMINHGTNLEFIALGSVLKTPGAAGEKLKYSTSANAQQLYCQIDSGFQPKSFVFGNIAYSIGVGGNIGGTFRGLVRGEVPQFTEIFDRTRHLALERIKQKAVKYGANSVIGIQTTIAPLLGTQEMIMLGTASTHPELNAYAQDPVTSDMTNEELWNVVNIGYLPVSLVMGVSVYSLGLTSGIMSAAKSIVGGEIQTLTDLLYEAREKALERVNIAAQKLNADEVVGVKVRVYDLGGGLVEFMAIGTAIKKVPSVTTKNPNLPPQAIIRDYETFVESPSGQIGLKGGVASARLTQKGPISFIISVIVFVVYLLLIFSGHNHH